MNESESSSAVMTALSIIRSIADLSRQTPRPMVVRLVWLCAGVAFVLAAVRTGPAELEATPDREEE